MFSLLSYGEILVDFLPDTNTNSYSPMAGGAPANVAVAFAKLGGSSYFAGGISTDNFGKKLIQQLESENVKTEYVNVISHSNTALVLVSLAADGERSFNFYRHDTADTYYEKEQIDNIDWQDLDIFHFCSNTLTSKDLNNSSQYALKKAQLNNTLISFDANLRQQLWSNLALLPQRVKSAIKQSDVIKFSKEEVDYLAMQEGIDYQDYISQFTSSSSKLIIVTDGSKDVQIASATVNTFIPVPSIKAVDTTAAGDSFIASFLFSMSKQSSTTSLTRSLTDLHKVSNAVVFAASCGAYTCQNKGAFAALPTINDI